MRSYEKEYKFCKFLLKLYLKKFFSYSTETPIDMGPQEQQISAKSKRQKWEKSSSKNKNDTNKRIEFLVKTFFGLVFTIIWQKKKHKIYGKNVLFSQPNLIEKCRKYMVKLARFD